MRGVAKRTEVRVVWSDQVNSAARARDAMQLFHRFHDVGDVLDQVQRANLVERVIGEGQPSGVHITQNIGGGVAIFVDADGPGKFLLPAADVEYAWQDGVRSLAMGSCERAQGRGHSKRRIPFECCQPAETL